MDSDEPQQSAVGEPAGQQLKRAREKRGLSLSDIADAQHLRVSVIQAIEDGHHDQIDSELFLKGYVRAYARQVGADADALIRSLDRELEPLRKEREKQEQEDPLVDIERRRRKKRRLARVLGIIVVLGAVTLAVWKLVIEPRMADGLPGISAQSGNTGGLNSVQPDSEPEPGQNLAPAASADPVEPSGYADSSVDKAVDSAQDSAVDSAAESPVDSSMDSNEPPGDPEPSENTPEVVGVADSVSSPEPESSGSVNDPVFLASEADRTRDNEPGALEPVTSEPAVQPDPVFAESAQPEAVVAPVRLQMSFISDCWVQVTDAAGARLVASLQRDGDQVSVSGRAPLNVVIGAVDAVDTIRFAGEPVDLSDFQVVNNRTEFTLTL